MNRQRRNAAPRTGRGGIGLVLDRSPKAIFSKTYWPGISLEINNNGGASCLGQATRVVCQGLAYL